MRSSRLFLILAIYCLSAINTVQAKEEWQLGLSYEFGHLSVVDELISQQQYSGNVTGWELFWSRHNSDRFVRNNISYLKGDEIHNYSVPARIQQFRLSSAWLFHIEGFQLFSRDNGLLLGPEFGAFIHFRRQKIGRTPSESAVLGMGTVSFSGIWQIMIFPSIDFNTRFRMAMISVAGKSNEVLRGEEEPDAVQVLPLNRAQDISLDFIFAWRLSESIDIMVGYYFAGVRVTAWDYFQSLTDHLTLSIGVRL